jgi:hypothetical protein
MNELSAFTQVDTNYVPLAMVLLLVVALLVWAKGGPKR